MQQLYPDVDVISKQFVYGSDPSEFDLITSDDSPLVGFTQEKLFTDQLCLVAAKGSLPEERERFISLIDQALDGKICLRPTLNRGI